MAEPQTLDLLGGQIDVDQVAGALSAIIPQQQAEALPTAEAEPVQMASAECQLSQHLLNLLLQKNLLP
jgi:hypothetical protein